MLARLVGVLALSALAVGCGNSGTGSVTGRVTVGGTPVKQGTIMFHSATGHAVVGSINEDGTYTLPGDGAAVGSHKVTISATLVEGGQKEAAKSIEDERAVAQKPGGKRSVPAKVKWVVPEKYSRLDTSDLTATVASGSNEINFEIRKP